MSLHPGLHWNIMIGMIKKIKNIMKRTSPIWLFAVISDSGLFFCYGNEENGHCACTNGRLTTTNQPGGFSARLCLRRWLKHERTGGKLGLPLLREYPVFIDNK